MRLVDTRGLTTLQINISVTPSGVERD
jgi:hypothetical protein